MLGRVIRSTMPMALAVSLLVTRPVEAASVPVWNHDPASAVGPARWGRLDPSYERCATGIAQSPIDIAHASPARLGPLVVNYPDLSLVVENTGHVIEVPVPTDARATLRQGSATYHLEQVHVHAPSEHTVSGHRFAAEAHLVHRSAKGKLAVVALLIESGRHGNRLIDQIVAAAPHEAGEETHTGRTVNLVHLLSRHGHASTRIEHYWSYTGSLTTPPCTEDVTWFVQRQPVVASVQAIVTIHARVASFPAYDGFADDNRPLQARNGRTITHNETR